MTKPVRATIGCRDWLTFKIIGQENERIGVQPKFFLPDEVLAWLISETQGQWAWEGREERCRVYMEDRRDAMLFKLTWSDRFPDE
jgi:hypothetical protein